MKMIKHALFATVLLLTTAWGTTAMADTARSSVTLEFHRGYAPESAGLLPGGTSQEYAIINEDGLSAATAARFTNYGHDALRSRRFPAGRRFTVSATTTYLHVELGIFSPGGPDMSDDPRRCDALARFTPVATHTYAITQVVLSLGDCDLQVVDTATGESPSDLEVSNHPRDPHH